MKNLISIVNKEFDVGSNEGRKVFRFFLVATLREFEDELSNYEEAASKPHLEAALRETGVDFSVNRPSNENAKRFSGGYHFSIDLNPDDGGSLYGIGYKNQVLEKVRSDLSHFEELCNTVIHVASFHQERGYKELFDFFQHGKGIPRFKIQKGGEEVYVRIESYKDPLLNIAEQGKVFITIGLSLNEV